MGSALSYAIYIVGVNRPRLKDIATLKLSADTPAGLRYCDDHSGRHAHYCRKQCHDSSDPFQKVVSPASAQVKKMVECICKYREFVYLSSLEIGLSYQGLIPFCFK